MPLTHPLDSSERRCFLNPVTMHCFYLIEDCDNNLTQARDLAALQLRCGGAFGKPAKHSLAIYAVLNGECPGAA